MLHVHVQQTSFQVVAAVASKFLSPVRFISWSMHFTGMAVFLLLLKLMQSLLF